MIKSVSRANRPTTNELHPGQIILSSNCFLIQSASNGLILYSSLMIRFLSLLLFGNLLLASSAVAERFYVNASADPGGDGRSWATAFVHLQDALDQTEHWRFDEVWIAGGTYYPDRGAGRTPGDRRAIFEIASGVTLWGGFAGWETSHDQRDWIRNRTILSGAIHPDPNKHSYHVTQMMDATLDGVEIRSGHAIGEGEDGKGAAIRPLGNNNLRNVVIADNRAVEGAVAAGGDWNVINSTFENNSALARGGVASGGNWSVSGSIFRNNSAPQGGVAYGGNWWNVRYSDFQNNTAWTAGVGYGGYWRPHFSRFSGNSANEAGVAINATWVVTDSVFENNLANNAGVFKSGTVNLVNSVASGNAAGQLGGFSDESNVTAVNSVFTGNSASSGGVGSKGEWNVTNSTFHNNVAQFGSIGADNNWQVYNSILNDPNPFFGITGFTNARFFGFPNAGFFRSVSIIRGGAASIPQGMDFGGPAFVLDVDPGFVDSTDPIGPDGRWGTADDGLRLTSQSPALNRGSGLFLPPDSFDVNGNGNRSEPMPIDLTGAWRVVQGNPDLGAYETGSSFARAHLSVVPLGHLWNLGPDLKVSDTFGEMTLHPRKDRAGFYSYSLVGWIWPHLEGFSSPQFGSFTATGFPGWIDTSWFGRIHYGTFAGTYGGFVFSDRFGWMRFVEAENREHYLWVPRLKTWLSMMGGGSFHSFDFGIMEPRPGSLTHYDTNIGLVIVDEDNPDGFIRSERFGMVWFARDTNGTWFYSDEREEWIGITPEGGLWSTKENQFLKEP